MSSNCFNGTKVLNELLMKFLGCQKFVDVEEELNQWVYFNFNPIVDHYVRISALYETDFDINDKIYDSACEAIIKQDMKLCFMIDQEMTPEMVSDELGNYRKELEKYEEKHNIDFDIEQLFRNAIINFRNVNAVEVQFAIESDLFIKMV